MKLGMVKNVHAQQVSSRSMEYAEHATLTHSIMVEIVCAIMAFMEMLTNVDHAILVVDNALVPMQGNA